MKLKLAILVIVIATVCGCRPATLSGDPLAKVLAGGAAVCGDEEIQRVALDFAKEKIFESLDEAPSPYAIAFYVDGGSGPPPYNEQTSIRAVKTQIRLLGFDAELGQTRCSLPLEFKLHDGSVGRSDITFWTQVNADEDDWIVGLEGLSSPHQLLVRDRNQFLFNIAMNPNRTAIQRDERVIPSDGERNYASGTPDPPAGPPQDDPRERRINAPYETVRNEMIAEGYEPTPVGERADCEDTYYVDVCRRYSEVVDCSGTGSAFCEFNFSNKQGRRLTVVTQGETNLTAILIRAPE